MIIHPKFGKMLQNSSQTFQKDLTQDMFHNTRNSVDYSLSKPNNLGFRGPAIGQSIDTLKNSMFSSITSNMNDGGSHSTI